MYYLMTVTFVVDVVSTVPWQVIFPDNNTLPLLGFLKILRVNRIQTVISNMNTSQEFKSLCKMVMLFAIMLIYINSVGCIWNYVISKDENWVPNKDFLWIGTPQIYEYYYMTWQKRFLVALYIGYYLFGVGEVCPRTTTCAPRVRV